MRSRRKQTFVSRDRVRHSYRCKARRIHGRWRHAGQCRQYVSASGGSPVGGGQSGGEDEKRILLSAPQLGRRTGQGCRSRRSAGRAATNRRYGIPTLRKWAKNNIVLSLVRAWCPNLLRGFRGVSAGLAGISRVDVWSTDKMPIDNLDAAAEVQRKGFCRICFPISRGAMIC